MINSKYADKIREMVVGKPYKTVGDDTDKKSTIAKYKEEATGVPETEKEHALREFARRVGELEDPTPDDVSKLWKEFKDSPEYRDMMREKELFETNKGR